MPNTSFYTLNRVRLRSEETAVGIDRFMHYILQWYSAGLRAGRSGVRVSTGAGNFCLHHRVQTGSGAHPASYPTGTRGSFPGVKAAWA
jgi:hypothetical protein